MYEVFEGLWTISYNGLKGKSSFSQNCVADHDLHNALIYRQSDVQMRVSNNCTKCYVSIAITRIFMASPVQTMLGISHFIIKLKLAGPPSSPPPPLPPTLSFPGGETEHSKLIS